MVESVEPTKQVLDGILVNIVAKHDFDKVVASRVFVGGGLYGAARESGRWIEMVVGIKMEQARDEDPSFDQYSFDADIIPIVVEVL